GQLLQLEVFGLVGPRRPVRRHRSANGSGVSAASHLAPPAVPVHATSSSVSCHIQGLRSGAFIPAVGNCVSRGNRRRQVGGSGGDGVDHRKGVPMSRTTIRKRPFIAVVAAVIAVAAVSVVAASGASGTSEASFQLAANPKFANCLAKYPNDPSRPPRASV